MFSTPKSVLKEFDSLTRKFLWARNLDIRKWSLVSWDQVCKPKENGGFGLRQVEQNSLVLVAKLYWRWCKFPEQPWEKILNYKYLGGVDNKDISPVVLSSRGSMIWNTIKCGSTLIKEGLFWII